MTIRIWHSYSCNNSSSYRLIAKFHDPAEAKLAAEELAEFFAAHAMQIDARLTAANFTNYSEDPSEAQLALAAKYGFRWGPELLYWGDSRLVGGEPDLIIHDTTLIVYHSYCGGGLGAVPAYLRARGAEGVQEDESDLALTVLFRSLPGANFALDAELARIAETLDEEEDDGEPRWLEPVPAPWPHHHKCYGYVAMFRDAGAAGIHMPVNPRDLERVKTWLADRGIEHSSIRIDESEDERVFRTVRSARCRSCDGALDYLDPRIHDIETPQLVCKPCGGLYELSAFLRDVK
jgi:hypothetical protein